MLSEVRRGAYPDLPDEIQLLWRKNLASSRLGVIVIDGASSSGKSSVLAALSDLLPDRRSFSIDEFLPSLPPGFFAARASSDTGWVEICRAFHRHLVARKNDQRLVVEVMLPWPEAREDLFEQIGREQIHYVQLFCSLEELERRELDRGNRRRGLARSHFDRVYAFGDYNQRIDSTTSTPGDCARLVVEAVRRRATHQGLSS